MVVAVRVAEAVPNKRQLWVGIRLLGADVAFAVAVVIERVKCVLILYRSK